MISEAELPQYVGKEIPELSGMLCNKELCNSVHTAVNVLRDHTYNKMEEENFGAVKQCMDVAERLYKKGNQTVKNAIESVYVYSFSHMLFHDMEKRKMLLGMIPMSLYTAYVHQMLHSHL
jgi:ribosomal protein L31E